jgi:hypothetical protein
VFLTLLITESYITVIWVNARQLIYFSLHALDYLCRSYNITTLRMPPIGSPDADYVHKVYSELQYLAGSIAVCYMQRECYRKGGGTISDLIEYAAFVYGHVGLAKSLLYLCRDAVNSPEARLRRRRRRTVYEMILGILI